MILPTNFETNIKRLCDKCGKFENKINKWATNSNKEEILRDIIWKEGLEKVMTTRHTESKLFDNIEKMHCGTSILNTKRGCKGARIIRCGEPWQLANWRNIAEGGEREIGWEREWGREEKREADREWERKRWRGRERGNIKREGREKGRENERERD